MKPARLDAAARTRAAEHGWRPSAATGGDRGASRIAPAAAILRVIRGLLDGGAPIGLDAPMIAFPIAFAWLPGSSFLFSDFVGELVDLDREVDVTVRRAMSALDRVERTVETGAASMRLSLDVVGRLVGQVPESELDRLIGLLGEAEAGQRADDLKLSRLVAKVQKMIGRHNPPLAKRLGPVMARYNDVVARAKEELRDARWALMTIRSEQGRRVKGPVFSDPRELARYLADARH
jgi:hypothetical protein